jgi:hypothetical protein
MGKIVLRNTKISGALTRKVIFNLKNSFWTISNYAGKVLSGFNIIYSSGNLNINWGDGTSQPIISNTNVNHTFQQYNSESSLQLKPFEVFGKILRINCGTSAPRLGGTIDLSIFPNLEYFTNNNNDITAISGYEDNPKLLNFNYARNRVTGSIPDLSLNIKLTGFFCFFNLLTGSIPSLSANVLLEAFYCDRNQLTGAIPNLSNNIKLIDFRCYTNQLTGNIPNLDSNTALAVFYCQTNNLTGFAGGTVPITLGDFQAQNNQLTTTAVNAILSAFVAANKTTGTRILNLGGTGNAAPTEQGLIDKATLQSRGWTVTTN